MDQDEEGAWADGLQVEWDESFATNHGQIEDYDVLDFGAWSCPRRTELGRPAHFSQSIVPERWP